MNRTWWLLIPAAACEVGWAVGLKHADGPGMWLLTIALVVASFCLAIKVAQVLPSSTVYAVFVGLGASGSVMVDILFFGAPFSWCVVGFVGLMLIGIFGLKHQETA